MDTPPLNGESEYEGGRLVFATAATFVEQPSLLLRVSVDRRSQTPIHDGDANSAAGVLECHWGRGGSKMRALAVILAVGCACWAPTALLAAPGAAKPPMGYSNCAR